MQERSKKYNEVLLHGMGFFKPPKSSSRKAVESEAALGIDKKKIPIAPELRSLALELSGYLVSLCKAKSGTYCMHLRCYCLLPKVANTTSSRAELAPAKGAACLCSYFDK